ncbi:MAG TPA: GNAT family N-acetyltransferase, partial [Burkholderiales bacterium]|nr:GNAT family N-acetyltransferase [Burkholderiales bacterium]
TAIYGHYVRESVATFDVDAPGETFMAEKFGRMVEAGHPVTVAQTPDGSIVGYAYASTYRPRPAYRFTCEDTVYLAPDATGQGIGTALLGFLEAQAAARGVRSFRLETGSRQLEAIDLYSRAGYARCGPFGGYVEDSNSIFMSKVRD